MLDARNDIATNRVLLSNVATAVSLSYDSPSMKDPLRFSTLILLCVLSMLSALPVHAQLILTDCQGFTRAVQNVDPGSLNDVQVSVNDAAGNPLDGVEVQLTNSVTGEVITVLSQNGVATFQGVGTGTFSISSTAAGATVGTVSITTTAVATGLALIAVTTAAVLGGAATTGIVVGVDEATKSGSSGGGSGSGSGGDGSGSGGSDGGDGSDEGPGPGEIPTPDPTPQQGSGSSPTDSGGGSSEPSPTPEDCDCDPGADAPTLDENDFFANAATPLSPYS